MLDEVAKPTDLAAKVFGSHAPILKSSFSQPSAFSQTSTVDDRGWNRI
jgi:hypothetical protein